MKNFIYIVCSIVFCTSVTAQNDTIFHSNFTINSEKWGEGKGNNSNSKVQNGVYKLSHFRKEKSWRWYKTVGLNPAKDFYIEAKMKHTGGMDNQGFGLHFVDHRKSKNTRWNYFLLTGNQYFKIYEWEKKTGNSNDIKPWTKDTKVIKKTGQYNTMAIKREGVTTYFYINGEQVHVENSTNFWGAELGFILNKQMDAEVDYLLIKQDGEEINLVVSDGNEYKKENLGNNVNSEYQDLGPMISTDGNTLYYFRKKDPKNVGGEGKDDIWISNKQQDGNWGKAYNAGKPLNNESHNFVISCTPDGNSVLIANKYKKDGSPNGGGVSIAYRGKRGWKVPQEVIVEDHYNDNKNVNYCLSADMKVLISSVERNDSKGELDLYVSFLQGNNKYSKPVNMGSTINTFAKEMSPFLAADNLTLYFSSPGHPGYGSNDIFLSRRLDDTWTNWSKPENLGSEINTPNWDAYYTIPAKGDYAYLATSGEIYKVKVSEAAKPKPVVLIYGKVLDSKTEKPLEAEIFYYDLGTNKEVGLARSNPQTGEYKIVLPYRKNYSFLATLKKYYSISENMDVSDLKEYTEIEKNLLLAPLEVGQTVRLNNIFFEFNKANLLPESAAELDRLAKLMADNKNLKIELGGHTDNKGSDEYNKNLSQQRVNSVVEYLKQKGDFATRMAGVGYGEVQPIADNETEEGRKLNRRVEFKILAK